MRILIIQHKNFLNGNGGTEKIACFLANHFSSIGNSVEIATNEDTSGNVLFPLSKEVKISNIFTDSLNQIYIFPLYNYKGKNPFLWLKYKVQKKYRKFLNSIIYRQNGGKDNIYKYNLRQRAVLWKNYIDKTKPDVIITMSIESLLEITYQNHYDIPIINSTNGRPDYDYTDILWYRSKVDMASLENSYQYLSAIQILFENYKEFLPENYSGKISVIGNPVPKIDDDKILNHQREKEKYKIIHIGSLNMSCKQQDLLIRIFSRISQKYPQWELHLWGIGKDYDILYQQIEKLKLNTKVFLNGFTDAPLDKLKEADIFVFPSKYEGFPLALTEAMSMGLAVVGFSYCSGVNQLIEHSENGFLADNEEQMEQYIKDFIKDRSLREEFGKNAHDAMKMFQPEKIKRQWEELLDNILNK